MPSKFTEKEMRDLFGCDHQGMYKVQDMYVVQFLATPGPGGGQRLKYFFERNTKLITKIFRKLHCLNADALTCLLLRKLNNSIDDRGIKFSKNF